MLLTGCVNKVGNISQKVLIEYIRTVNCEIPLDSAKSIIYIPLVCVNCVDIDSICQDSNSVVISSHDYFKGSCKRLVVCEGLSRLPINQNEVSVFKP